jgi:DNA-binding transcriptional LysR family regulator
MMLDLESVRLFVLVAEFGNFTRAAEAAGTVQPVVSQRIRALETRIGRKLIDRTPRFVRLTDAGTTFLDHARRLLEAHDAALMPYDVPTAPLTLGVSDHALGTSFHLVLQRLRAALPSSTNLTFKLGQSNQIRDLFDDGEVDLAIIRREATSHEGEVLGQDDLGWYAAPGWVRPSGELPLILLSPPCGVRSVAVATLDRSSTKWREAFVGGSCLALTAAVRAGLGVAPLGRLAGADLAPLSIRMDLPALPQSRIVLLARASDELRAAAARAVSASVRDMLGDRARPY